MDLAQLKTLTLESAMSEAIVVHGSFLLVPVGPWILNDIETVARMADWRSRAKASFFSQVDGSTDSMFWYLQEYSINDRNRILFLIRKEDEFLGHLGLSAFEGNSAEIDNVMKAQQESRTVDSAQFLRIFIDFLGWAQRELGVEKFSLQVVSTNAPAIRLYRRAGFEFQNQEVGEKQWSHPKHHLIEVPEADSIPKSWMHLSNPKVNPSEVRFFKG